MENATLNATIEKDILEDTTRILSEQILNMGLVRSRSAVNELDLYDFYQPAMPGGEYTVDVAQTIKVDGYTNPETYSTKLKIKVTAPPKTLTPTDVYQMYPPKGAFGKYAAFLPHIVLNDAILPWQIPHFSKKDGLPWLALVLKDEDEGGNLVNPGQQVEVDKGLIPTKEDLEFLAHMSKRNLPQTGVRKKALTTEDKTPKSVIICNRFPTPGKTNTVYLIALDEKPTNDKYTCLFSWNFVCETQGKEGLKELLKDLSVGPYRLPNTELTTPTTEQTNILDQRKNQQAQGFVPLPHQTRMGQKIMSWYRGPLVPDQGFAASDDQTLINIKAINSADQLLRYSPSTKKMDVTYAAAWELGKWLTLQNKQVSIDLFKWKRQVATALKLDQQQQQSTDTNLSEIQKVQKQVVNMFTRGKEITTPDMPETITDWLQELLFLHPLPFNYLVPDERLLPDESIRFFTIDEGWIWAMIDGAMSVGRNPTERNAPPFGAPKLHLSGFLMRSDAISQYPDLKVEADGFELLEKRVIGNNIWLCIFKTPDSTAKVIDQVQLFLPQAGMRFGGEIDDGQIKKELANHTKIDIPFDDAATRVIHVQNLYNSLLNGNTQESKSGAFAFHMVQLAPKVVFGR